MRRTDLRGLPFVASVTALLAFLVTHAEHAIGAGGSDAEIGVHTSSNEATGSSESDPCVGMRDGLVVEVDRKSLHLCRDGFVDASYPVNLGQGGHGKTRQGDKKTPLGRYELGRPRASASGFTWFVPIGYPTKMQKKAGYTGGAIGIHGPPDWLPAWVIDLAFATPWTDGCVMVRTKDEIEAIRSWLLENKPRAIELR